MQPLLSVETNKLFVELLSMKWDNYDDFEKKYGSDVSADNYAKRAHVWLTYDTIGNLLKSGLADLETFYNVGTLMMAVWIWVKFKPVIEENRRRYGDKDNYTGLEYLATELIRMKGRMNPSYRVPESFMTYVSDENCSQ
jgi:hypothetical protein